MILTERLKAAFIDQVIVIDSKSKTAFIVDVKLTCHMLFADFSASSQFKPVTMDHGS